MSEAAIKKCIASYAQKHDLPAPDFSRELGRGFYGIAYATDDPKQVVKITEDMDEGVLMALQTASALPGIVPCYGCLKLAKNEWALWKEALHKVGEDAWEAVFGGSLEDGILAHQDFWRVARIAEDGAYTPLEFAGEMTRLQQTYYPLRDICETLLYLANAYQDIPTDMHINNFGCFNNGSQIILFDAQMGVLAQSIEYESCSDV